MSTILERHRGQARASEKSIVCSFNEWDLLEEVIVGTVHGSIVPSLDDHMVRSCVPKKSRPFFEEYGGKPFPSELIDAAEKDLESLVKILRVEGVTVRRPDPISNSQSYATPHWKSATGLYQAMPRDLLLVIGNEIIETPMAWRNRYYEVNAYRNLLKEYFNHGCKWTSAPKPMLTDALYCFDYEETIPGKFPLYAINEHEPTFDAADFIRCGKDIFVHKSNVTNAMGIEWLRRHLGDQYSIHEIEVCDTQPMHIDSTLMPLAPGQLLINPERVKKVPEQFKNWNVIIAPPPVIPHEHPLYFTSRWINMNLVMIDTKRVIVEENEEPIMEVLAKNGFEPIPCPFRNFNTFGGSFHCATLDIRRKGELQSYFE